MVTVKFINVGKDKTTWEEELPDDQYSTLVKAIKDKKVFFSDDIDIEFANGGIYLGIARRVGSYEVIK